MDLVCLSACVYVPQMKSRGDTIIVPTGTQASAQTFPTQPHRTGLARLHQCSKVHSYRVSYSEIKSVYYDQPHLIILGIFFFLT